MGLTRDEMLITVKECVSQLQQCGLLVCLSFLAAQAIHFNFHLLLLC